MDFSFCILKIFHFALDFIVSDKKVSQHSVNVAPLQAYLENFL